MLNSVVLVGRLTRDVELRTSSNGKSFAPFTLAVDGMGMGNQTSFISCFAWNKTAENMSKYLHKGSLIAVMGVLTSRQDTQNGQMRTVMQVNANQVKFLDSKNSARNYQNNNSDSSLINSPKTADLENSFNELDKSKIEESDKLNEKPLIFEDEEEIIWD